MADVTARSLQYEYKAVRVGSAEGSGRGSPIGRGRLRKGVFSLKVYERTAKAEEKSEPGEGGGARRYE